MLRVLSIFPTSNAYFSHAHVQDWRGLQACAALIWEELHPVYFADAEAEPMLPGLSAEQWKAIKSDLRARVIGLP